MICAIIVIGIFARCEKEHAVNTSSSRPLADTSLSLPLADTAFINDTTIFFDVVIDGQRQLQIQPLNKFDIYWAGHSPFISGSTYGLYVQGLTNGFGYGITLTRGNIDLAVNDTSLQLKNQRMVEGFNPGAYPYTTNPNSSTGVQIQWTDGNGKKWATNFGPADQSGGTFEISQRLISDTSYQTSGITHGLYILCNFSCILYDSTGKSLNLTNGKMRLSVWL